MASANTEPSEIVSTTPEVRILVIYTGGTIGMTLNKENVLAPMPGQFEQRIRKDFNFHDEKYNSMDDSWLVLPALESGQKRILYRIKENKPLLDSSNMGVVEWKLIAEDIFREYNNYDGFVVLHGTDTLAYTGSALSFMFQELNKPVIVTGSQIPIYQTRSDGKENFVAALIIAGLYKIPEVCVVFRNKVMRANRTVKVNCDSFDAFDSPNYPLLATMGVKIKVNESLIIRPIVSKPFNVQLVEPETVTLIHITPGMPMNQITASLAAPVLGVVLQSFGAGNIPSNNKDLLELLKSAIDRDAIIVNCTQCLAGSVADAYDASAELLKMGVIFVGDMTFEAAYTKLYCVLSMKEYDLDQKKKVTSNADEMQFARRMDGPLRCVRQYIIGMTPLKYITYSLGKSGE